MKKLLLIITLFILSAQINFVLAQCTPDTSIYATGSYLYPAKIPFATVNIPYSQVLTFKIPLDSFISGIKIHVDSAQLYKIYGIPSGYGYQCNKPNCAWNGGTIGCALLSGLGDSTMIGSYTMYVYIETFIKIGNNPPYTSTQRFDSSSYTFKVLRYLDGVFEVSPYQQLKVYPNPVNDFLTIELNDIQTNHNNINVFDATGRNVYSKEFSKPTIYTTTERIDLSIFPKGLYTVVLKTDEKTSIRKVLKN
ncbi:MAG: T9SS type A sorting domain-containing protein [Bacteroidota bacterium]